MGAPLWVFGYGSLIWDPGFRPEERHLARLTGWHRSFCMRSIHYRGTAEAPGLVLALDEAEGGVCDGVAFRVADAEADGVLAALRERELISYAYHEAWLPVTLADGQQVKAVTYVINREGEQYCTGLSVEEQAAIIGAASGVRGPNRDYLLSTAEHLAALGIADADLDHLATLVRQIAV